MSDLTKWPRLLVTGTPITPEQADEILVRTSNPYLFHGNDPEWTHTIHRAFGLTEGEHGIATMESIRTVTDELGILPLTMLYTSRITSSWIGGPHGWCDWDGTIGCANYNVGKWPDAETILTDWQTIAAAFPFLDLTCQLKADEGAGPIAGQWRVVDGQAHEETPAPLLTGLVELAVDALVERLFLPGGERGVTEQHLTDAVARVRTARAALH